MKKLLEKLKLVQYFNSELTMSNDEFLNMMSEKVDQETPGFLSDSIDAWTKHRNKFKGVFSIDKIVFKRRQSFFNGITSIPEATATFQENYKKIRVITKLNALKGPFLMFSIFILIAIPLNLIVAIRIFSRPEIFHPNVAVIILASTFMFIVPYIFMRIGIAGLRKKISQELYKLESKFQ